MDPTSAPPPSDHHPIAFPMSPHRMSMDATIAFIREKLHSTTIPGSDETLILSLLPSTMSHIKSHLPTIFSTPISIFDSSTLLWSNRLAQEAELSRFLIGGEMVVLVQSMKELKGKLRMGDAKIMATVEEKAALFRRVHVITDLGGSEALGDDIVALAFVVNSRVKDSLQISTTTTSLLLQAAAHDGIMGATNARAFSFHDLAHELRGRRGSSSSIESILTETSTRSSSSSSSSSTTCSVSNTRTHLPAPLNSHRVSPSTRKRRLHIQERMETDPEEDEDANTEDDRLDARDRLIDALSTFSTPFLCLSFPLSRCTSTHPSASASPSSPKARRTWFEKFEGSGAVARATPALGWMMGVCGDGEGEIEGLEWVRECVHPEDGERLVAFLYGMAVPTGDGSVSGGVGEEIGVGRMDARTSVGEFFVVAVRLVRREWDGSRGQWISTFAFLPFEETAGVDTSLAVASAVAAHETNAQRRWIASGGLVGAITATSSAHVSNVPVMTMNALSPVSDYAASTMAAADRACRESERFARLIGRELRDPLTGIIGSVWLLEQSMRERSRLYSLVESAFFRAKEVAESAAAMAENQDGAVGGGAGSGSDSGVRSSYPSPDMGPVGISSTHQQNATSGQSSSPPSSRSALAPNVFDVTPLQDMKSIVAIAECLDRSRSVIDDVLDLSRIEKQSLRLFPTRFDPKRDMGVGVRLNVPVDDLWIAADRGRFEQAITSLVAFSIHRASMPQVPVKGKKKRERKTTEVEPDPHHAYPVPHHRLHDGAGGFDPYYLDDEGRSVPPPMHLTAMPGTSFGTTMTHRVDEAEEVSASVLNLPPPMRAGSSSPVPPHPRTVTIGLDASLSHDGSLWITVTSQDNGPTLTEDEAEYVGVGPALGLIVGKHLAEVMGGEVKAVAGPALRGWAEGGWCDMGMGMGVGGEEEEEMWRGAMLSFMIPSSPVEGV
ncbi:hypothetical protein BC829DRAFT_441043 [Chytridium lagenaria]|nr:hypothetical protein BC829DRAFT_441043 [Chytridium lagenaria]